MSAPVTYEYYVGFEYDDQYARLMRFRPDGTRISFKSSIHDDVWLMDFHADRRIEHLLGTKGYDSIIRLTALANLLYSLDFEEYL